MKLKIIVHEAGEGGNRAEALAIPGCATQGDTFEELLSNIYMKRLMDVGIPEDARVMEIVV